MQRRGFLAMTGAALVVPALPAHALTEGRAKTLVSAVINDINGVIASGKGQNAMFREFECIFARYSDTSYISAYAMGADSRRASGAQKRAFSNAFQGYIARKYGSRFREFIGGRLEVKNVKAVKNWYEVETTAFLRGQSPFAVTFHVSDRSGKDLFFNMFIEGINLLLTERTEIGALIDRNGGSIDGMITDLGKA